MAIVVVQTMHVSALGEQQHPFGVAAASRKRGQTRRKGGQSSQAWPGPARAHAMCQNMVAGDLGQQRRATV